MKRLIVDMSSVCWTALLAGVDKEFGRKVEFEGRDHQVNSAQYGYENAMNHLVSVMKQLDITPIQMIFVVEGPHSKAFRQALLPEYKVGRGKRPEASYVEFNKLKEMLVESFLAVGASAVTQSSVEADDVIAYLAQTLQGERYVLSADGDLAVLVQPGVHLMRSGELDANPYGPFPHKFITVYKALVGDSSDTIPGAKGFGPKSFLDLCVIFGDDGLELMEGLIKSRQLDRLVEDVADFKPLQKIIDSSHNVYRSWDVASLYTNRVNTLRLPLQWWVGMVKPLSLIEDERLKPFGQRVRLIDSTNYAEAVEWMKDKLKESPFVALDIETSTPPESDDWLMLVKGGNDNGMQVDVRASKLTGMGLTFGRNNQYTFYFTHDHKDSANLASSQIRDVVASVPEGTPIVIQNVNFELPILYLEWGKELEGNGWHGFIPLAHDTKIMSSYVNENIKSGLKQSSKYYLGYDQQTYQEVTTIDGVQYKMNQLTAKHVLGYGADDTIVTAALYNHYRTIMEVENSWDVYQEVEIKPAYLTALAFAQGIPVNMEAMHDLSKADEKAFDEAWVTVREYLIGLGWEGTVCPDYSEVTPANVKEAVAIYSGKEFSTRKRKLDAMAADIREQLPELDALAAAVEAGDAKQLTSLVKSRFTGEPVLDINSPKQMQILLYDVMKMPPRILNDVTEKERVSNPALAAAVSKYKRIRSGSLSTEMTPEETQLLRLKAKADDTAIDTALAFDSDKVNVDVLKAIGVMKTVDTRRKLYYRPYNHICHWNTGRIHSSINQCSTVTRRYSSSGPNLQQLPKKGEGVKFRAMIKPHRADAVVCSIDFSGQELRLAAERSQDKNMLSCYIGDNLRDIHSITASGAMKLKWGVEFTRNLFDQYKFDPLVDEAEYWLFMHLRKLGKAEPIGKKADDLRKDSKNVNFAAQFGGQAPKLADTLIMPIEDARLFLEARSAKFPDVDVAAERSAEKAKTTGYAETLMGARRHLGDVIRDGQKFEVERACRQSWNMEIQGSAAEMSKLAMARVWDSGVCFTKDFRFYAPIHDELVFSVAAKDALESIKTVHTCMVAPYSTMKVPILGSISVGPNFADQHECGDWYIEENIKEAIDLIFADAPA